MTAKQASLAEAAAVAANSLLGSKLRSFLTLLGIILATTTLIAVMSVIHGMDKYIAENVSNMGVDGFRILRMAFVGNFDPKKFLELQRKNPELSLEEFEFLKANTTLLREFGMSAGRSNISIAYGSEEVKEAFLQGVSANMGVITNVQPAQGRFLTDTEDRRRMPVAFIGNDLKDRFFPNADPIGKTIQVAGRPFEVVGVAKALGSVFGQSRDNFVMIPVQTYLKMWGARRGLSFAALAIDRNRLFQSQDEIRMLLRAYRHVRPGGDDNFAIISSDSLVEAWDRLTGAIAATAMAVVSVFMVVGGVVIMNIMLAVVTERTHEIGIRKSVGARRQDILNQFLVESSMLAASGGLIGVLIAWVITLIVNAATPVPMSMPVTAVLTGVTLSAMVGLFFGVYPAHKASKLDPIEALRVER
ncbi:MAG TPA: ABC transporter permease [Solibacterales bacterium]|nr:ABC transporter permease [Bryobacterales bacterium]